MNIFEKVQKIRVELQNTQLTKSGKNSFISGKDSSRGYSYFELGDYLPKVNELMEKHNIASIFTMDSDVAYLTLVNAEKPSDRIRFRIPVADLQLKGGQPIQNLGGKVTYLRRYLTMAAFEIVENDIVDAQAPVKELSISEEEKQKIAGANTPQELVKICNELKKAKGQQYHKSIAEYYELQKEVLKQTS